MLFCERNQKLRKFVGLGFRGFGLECLEGVCASRRELAMDGKRRALVAAILGAGVIAGSVVAVLVRSWHGSHKRPRVPVTILSGFLGAGKVCGSCSVMHHVHPTIMLLFPHSLFFSLSLTRRPYCMYMLVLKNFVQLVSKK
jgi:hypothetical protein